MGNLSRMNEEAIGVVDSILKRHVGIAWVRMCGMSVSERRGSHDRWWVETHI